MTTTAVRTPRVSLLRDRVLLDERIQVTPRRGVASARQEDSCQVGVMRRKAAAKLRHSGCQALIDEVMLIVSELLTNALLHSGTTEIRLIIAVKGEALHIAVRDGVPGEARPRAAGDDKSESGRGLLLVEALSRESGGSWGTSDAGAETWCSLKFPPGCAP